MAPVAIIFALLNNEGAAAELGLIRPAGVLATVICLITDGVADRLGRRVVMLGSGFTKTGLYLTP
jgi:hypothetical protein